VTKAKLFCKTGRFEGTEFEISTEATIGRVSENTIQLNGKNVSEKHARIYYDKDQSSYFLEDLESLNGTQLDGAKVTGQEKLARFHVITFAKAFDFVFQVDSSVSEETALDLDPWAIDADLPSPLEEGDQASRTPQSTGEDVEGEATAVQESFAPIPQFQQEESSEDVEGAATAVQESFAPIPQFQQGESPQLGEESTSERTLSQQLPVDPQLPPEVEAEGDHQVEDQSTSPQSDDTRVLLEVKNKEGAISIFDLKEGENFVGRSPDCEVFIDDSSVSRQHAIITVSSGRTCIRDLGSVNQTLLEDTRIDSEVELRPNQKVQIGTIEVRLVIQKGL